MKECVTHHHACDCREAKFAKLEADLAAAQRELAAWQAALALPEDSKTVNAELYKEMQAWADENVRQEIDICKEYSRLGLPLDEGDIARVDRIIRYLELREASGEPMPYKVIRDGDKVRFL